MSDQRLRELERRWKETGSVEDEAAWLRERVRSGDLARNMLELAAYLGHPPARLALENHASTPPEDPKKLVLGLSQWGKECCVRAALSAAQSCLPVSRQHPDDNITQKAIEATINWIVNPTDQTKAAANNAAIFPRDINLEAERAAAFAALAASADADRTYSWAAAKAAFSADMAVDRADLRDKFDALLGYGEAKATNISQVRQAIIKHLIPWALGYSDPVRERVEARQRDQTGTS